MSRALALLADGRVITVCCGGHRPASDCLCCAECVTNVDAQRHAPDERAATAREARAQAARWRTAVEAATRWAWRTVVREHLDDWVHQLDDATRHAVAMPTAPERPVLPELDALGLVVPSPWFRASVVPA